MKKTPPAKDISTYLRALPRDSRIVLQKLRETVRAAAPEAEEAISYRIPLIKFHGPLVFFAAFERHCSLFVASKQILRQFAPELEAFYGEPIPLDRAIRVMTLNGAWSMGLEHEAGSITPGKRADLIVLDRNLFEANPAGGIRGSRIELTLVDGKPTWDAGRLLEPLGLSAVWQHPAPEL